MKVETDAMGEFYVDLVRYGWFPNPETESEEEP